MKEGIRAARRAAGAAAVLALCGTALTACGTEPANRAGSASPTGIVCPDGSTPNASTGDGGAGEDLTSDDVGGTGEDLTSDDVGGTGEDLTSEDVGGTGEDLTSDPGAAADGLPEGPSECWGPDYGKDQQSAPPRVNGVPTVGAHRWYGMKGEFTAYLKSTPSTTDDAVLVGIRMIKIRKPEHSDVMEARIASDCGPWEEKCDAQAKAFGDWRRKKYGDRGHVVVFGGAKTTVEAQW
ncbi:hypothetical protein ACH4SP_29995 [Streptomyces sp. NPDC021093]|uniref:hypothetical protein n=1 Tax=Streptomyces sp. NPDC021093 TaxID=3365112 RepID=UPI0037A5D2F9